MNFESIEPPYNNNEGNFHSNFSNNNNLYQKVNATNNKNSKLV
jgi:hypothetical protein